MLTTEVIYQHQYNRLITIVPVGVAWLVSFAVLYWLTLSNISNDDTLFDSWASGYMPLSSTALENIDWLWENFLGLSYLSFFAGGPAGISTHPGWFSGLNILMLFLMFTGTVCTVFLSRRLFLLLILIYLIALLLSMVQAYPFRARLILYLLPFVFIAISALIEWVAFVSNKPIQQLAWVLAVSLVTLVAFKSVQIWRIPQNHDNVKGALTFIATHQQPGDLVAVNARSLAAYTFYAPQFNLENINLFEVIPLKADLDRVFELVCQNPRPDRIWLMISHGLSQFDSMSNRFSELYNVSWRDGGAAVYLLDFSDEGQLRKYCSQ
jgi:hypothetical protein